MRTFTTSILASFALVGMACSDGSGGLAGGGDPVSTGTSSTGTDMTGSTTGTPGAGGSSATTGMGGSETTGTSGTQVMGAGGMSGAGGSGMMTGTDAGSGGAGGSMPMDGLKHGPFKMLMISTTLEFHHDSIPTCLTMLQELGKTSDADLAKIGAPAGSTWTVDQVGSDPNAATYFSEITAANLANYDMVYSDNPTGPVFTNAPNGPQKKQIFQDYWTNGGSWAGQHSATDFENNNKWTWFQDNVNGGWFVDHDGDQTPGTVVWESAYTNHSILKGLASPWNTSDEWYIMNRNIEAVPGFKILGKVTVPSSTKNNGKTPRPAIWITENAKGGRSFYTIRGHNQLVYKEPEFRELMLRGILWAVHRLP